MDIKWNFVAPLYDIDSVNTVQTTILSSALENTNAFLVSKISPDNVINTMVPSGAYVLSTNVTEGKGIQVARTLVNITLKPITV
ncbi:hypothetical protein [Chengkuizengella axinellae]|uniref:Uncharacterized protein n=1 Tax=Chengkuizengella axinellae TaxID=3064388 RepID=A0ABT9J4X1_9BACL|nr:hypothetical protein [Chengkuizengella sp. 2205SS18-9]MDP5276523.1 hypothetical protein [Chengkuizengella sp. 2205SS18-9]